MPPSKRTIAIVEDDASFRRAIERLLRAIEFEAQTFASAEEFLGSATPGAHACLILRFPTAQQLPSNSVRRWTKALLRRSGAIRSE